MSVTRIGIVGSGFMGRTHAEATRRAPGAKLVAIAGGKRAVGLAAGVILLETGAVLMLWLICAAYFWVVINNSRVGA